MFSLEPGVSTLETPGFVYFIQARDGGLIKIGWATKPEVRLEVLQAMCPITLRILLTVPGSGKLERELHSRFAEARRHGEWFEPVAAILEQIEVWRMAPPPTPAWEPRKPLRDDPPKKRVKPPGSGRRSLEAV